MSEPDAQTDPIRDKSRGPRLQKFMADVGVGSRRACEELIDEGRVRVNGRVVRDLPAWVDPSADEVVVDGRRLVAPQRNLYVMLNKPRRCVSTLFDPEGRRHVGEMVNHPSGARLFPVGRLDFDTSGLLLMTNDGELANRLTHPRYGVHKTYRATLKGRLDEDAVKELEQGVFLAERSHGRTAGARRTLPVKMRIVSRDRDRTVLDITLREGRNRQVRRMLAAVDRPVRKLVRTHMGSVKLAGLRTGEWRELTRDELRALKRDTRPAGGRDRP